MARSSATPNSTSGPAGACESPRHDLIAIVEELQAAVAGVPLDDIHHAVRALVDAQRRPGAAEVGLDPAGVHQQQRPRVAVMARGVAAHELVEGGLAGPVDLVPAPGVQ